MSHGEVVGYEGEVLVGRPGQVVWIEDDRLAFHVQLQGGAVARITSELPVVMALGDSVIVGEHAWQCVPNNIWQADSQIGIVRLIKKKTVLLETAIGLRKVRITKRQHRKLHEGNTVEYDGQGILGVVAEAPIRVRDFGAGPDAASAYRIDPADLADLTFDSFGGYKEVRDRAIELIETQLNRKELLDTIGARPIKGVIFTGPPGTGKTHLARVIAAMSDATFYLVSGPSIVSKWVGDSEETLRLIFEAATADDRAIIFFDEIDSIAEHRSGDSHEASKRLVAQLLTLLDGFGQRGNVVVIAATNRVDDVDDALLRPGRFDWEIEFGRPNQTDREEILQASGRNLRQAADLPLAAVAAQTDGWSAARLTSIWTEAALVAAEDGRDRIADEDVAAALERVSLRPTRTRRSENHEKP